MSSTTPNKTSTPSSSPAKITNLTPREQELLIIAFTKCVQGLGQIKIDYKLLAEHGNFSNTVSATASWRRLYRKIAPEAWVASSPAAAAAAAAEKKRARGGEDEEEEIEEGGMVVTPSKKKTKTGAGKTNRNGGGGRASADDGVGRVKGAKVVNTEEEEEVEGEEDGDFMAGLGRD